MKKNCPFFKVPVGDLRESAQHYDVVYTPEQLDLADESFTFVGPVSVSLDCEMIGHEVYMTGSVSCDALTECVRCLGEARVKLCAAVKVMYEKNADLLTDQAQFLGTEDGGVAYFDGEKVVPDTQLREALMLELPDMPHCSDSCRGLCVQCGVNLNTGACTCAQPAPIVVRDEEDAFAPAVSESWKDALRNLKLN